MSRLNEIHCNYFLLIFCCWNISLFAFRSFNAVNWFLKIFFFSGKIFFWDNICFSVYRSSPILRQQNPKTKLMESVHLVSFVILQKFSIFTNILRAAFFVQKCYLQHFCTYIRFVFVFLAKGNQQKICSQKLVKLVNFYLTGRQNMKFRAHLNISFAYVFSALHCINCILEVLTLVSMEIFEPRKVLPKCDIMQKMHV